ncbi:MAG: glycosyltransferase, partial [Spirochaetales bacterium]|nr:glycosyltransferase [Spirochaetales bacterium]
MKIKVLALSYLFPNKDNPDYGIFVFNRLKAVAKQCDGRIIAPLQWFPLFNKYRRAAGGKKIGNYEKFGELDVFYPRFFSIPKFFKWVDSFTYFLSIIPTVCFLKYKQKFNFDVVDVHWTYPDILAGYLIAKIYRKKLIVTIRGKEALYPGEVGGRKLILDWCLKRADVVVNLSSELEGLVHQIGVSSDRTKVIYNGVDLAQFTYRDKQKARAILNLPEDRKILLSVGSLIRRKGHDELIKSMSALSRNVDIDLYIVGGINPEGDYSAELKSLATTHGASNIHFIETLNHDQLSIWYAAA